METLRQLWDRLQRADMRASFLRGGGPLLGVLALNILFYIFFTGPRLAVAAGSREAFEQTEQSLQRERATARDVRDRLSQVRCVSADLETFRRDVLSSKQERMTKVQKNIRELARAYNMNPNNITYGVNENQEQSLLSFEVSFPLEGSYSDLRQFLHHVESSEHFLLVEQITLKGSKHGGTALGLNIRLSTYFAQDPQQEPVRTDSRTSRRLP